jgi:formate--tetrahydrofolate ligase
VQATRMALKLGDYCVTEAGFGADLGAEKFYDIKCRYAGLKPDAAVLVATIRALKMHGGVALADLKKENLKALAAGVQNLEKHLENLQSFGPPVVVAINRFPDDTEAEIALLRERVGELGAKVVLSEVWAKGGEGGLELAEEVVRLCEVKQKPVLKYAYELGMSIPEKIEKVATDIYGADGVDYHYEASAAIERFTRLGYGTLPVCMAKTQSSLSDDKTKPGRPRNWKLTVREIRLSAGAGMVIPVCGSIMTMPGLPARPAAENIDLINGEIVGLF